METIAGHLYDFPTYYDLIFGSDWKAEYKFLLACFERFSKRPVKRIFEPACGTGRLLVKLAEAGYEVAGNDLNEKAVAFCNKRFERKGLKPVAVVGDMADFKVKKKYDAAFNMINTFRHLPSEETAEAHLACVAEALAKGGVYLLGLHLTPVTVQQCTEECWSAGRGNLTVNSRLWSIGVDLQKREERIGMTYDVYTPTKQFRIEDETMFRTWTAEQMAHLLLREPRLELIEVYDFRYDIDAPVMINGDTEDVVYVLRKR
ncbi:class I SAM-dependent methyltransferase [Planctellipticum variicoloris]|uniref:class I SAM-dependent methyltransferase n=1 Tax=Planctellipticum variicoloris TaxID=3064265 RepID=UPI002C84B9B4|nr:class I SAM-dependent methyltransferase [Planctomycetaceae bacterium SH412]HTN00873.1 class I SAM-dependent methyltransferase [Planctomycetaceae bacterium]